MAGDQPKPLPGSLGDFVTYYGRELSRAERAVEREVFGSAAGINSYTTPAQTELLADALRLRPGVQLLDVGSGSGWPALYLAQRTGCDAVLTDVPVAGIRSAAARASDRRLLGRCAFVAASGTDLPFRSRSFDAVAHSDVL